MNILLWVFQILLALHTITGAIWKFSNPAQNIPSLSVIPNGVWLGMSVVELLCAAALILPIFSNSLGKWAPKAAVVIAAEMLIFCAINLLSAASNTGEIVYWLVVAVICSFIAYGRFVLKPIR